MKKVAFATTLVAILAMVAAAAYAIVTWWDNKDPGYLTNLVEERYQETSRGETPTLEQIQEIRRLYSRTNFKKLSEKEWDELDEKIDFIADTYLEYQRGLEKNEVDIIQPWRPPIKEMRKRSE